MPTPTHDPPRYRSLALFFWVASSALDGASAQAAPFAALDEALLVDLISAYDTHEDPPDECTSQSSVDATTFSFDWPGSNDGSAWEPAFVHHEESVFQASMSHDAGAGNDTSWTMRIGTGGNVYSHYVPDLYGETIPPQARDDSPWIDEVQQCVAVNEKLNRKRNVYDPGAAVKQFVHQAGAYQRDAPYTDDPFFSPSLARHCSGNSCYFASWGTQAHAPTPFTSPIMYVNKYTNCGGGVIERMMMIHNFAPVNPDASDTTYKDLVDHTFFNVDWGGVRASTLPYPLEPQPLDGTFSYADPDNVDTLRLCSWPNDGPDGTNNVWRGERQELKKLRGYTAFATPDLIVNQNWTVDENGYLDPYELPCRTGTDPTCATANSCMVSTCTQQQIDEQNYTRLELNVAAHSTPNCKYHDDWIDGLFTLQCDFRDEEFGNSNPYQIGARCTPWVNFGFKNMNTSSVLEVLYVRHWSFNSNDRRVYFAINETDSTDAINLVNAMFDNTNGNTPLEIRVVPIPKPEAEPGYDASTVAAFTYVYGLGSDHPTNIKGRTRRRIGSSRRDYTVFTINWYSGIRLGSGSTYVNRSFKFAGRLGDVASTAGALVDQTFADQVENELWRPRRVDLYSDSGSSRFGVAAADAAGGDSTTCGGAGTTLACEGYSTPQADHRALFYMNCGASTVLDFDPYYFAPDFGASFPLHGTVSNPVRSYEKVCDANGVANSARPTWKLVGFFNASCAELDQIKTHAYDETVCGNSASPTSSPSASPSNAPTTASPTTSPTASPTATPSKPPTASPSNAPTTASPSTSPTSSPTSSPSKSPSASPSNAPTTASPSRSPTASPTATPSKPPSASPSSAPTTASPSRSPTASPTSSPSKSPSASPSTSPTTASPSTSPTASPTASPSKSPSASPSSAPTTASPSRSPTASPTANPSKPPTASPSTSPTTASPSTSPTASPTSSPSKSPTASPSNAPTTASPSTSPTASPTSSPSKSPTANPSNAPTTASPSTSPTASPTSSPTSSALPTRNPTMSPTSSRTKRPSNAPTRLPTNKPTLNPQTQLVEVEVTVKKETKTTTVSVSSSLRLDNFTLPENPDEKEALLQAVRTSLAATVGEGLADNQRVDSITILRVGGEPVNIGNRRLLDRILENNDGVIDWVAVLAEVTIVITKTDQAGNVIEVSLNGQDIPVDGLDDGAVPSANTIGRSIVEKVDEAMVAATESNDFFETLTQTVEIVAASQSAEVQAALSALVNNVIIDSVETDLDQEISPAQESEFETSTDTVPAPVTTTFKIGGRITFSNTVISQEQVGDFAGKTETVIEDIACPSAGVRSCQGSVLRVNGQSVSARLRRRSRSLQDSTSLVAEFELVLVAICSTSDCSDAQSIGNALYSQVTGDLLAAIRGGSLVSALQAASQELATLLTNAKAAVDFSELVAAIAVLSDWYPDWRGGSGTCKNDGNAPTYMKIYGTYYKPSLEACCSHYFSWDLFACTGDAGSVPSGFFPNWGQTETKCLNSTVAASTLPDYMRNNPEQWLENDVESCCKRHYNWAYNDCTVLSGGNPYAPATGKWYVNHQDEICQMDCPEEGGGPCGGLANAWDTLYESPAACCTSQLSWIASATCEAQSTLMPVVGSSQWYVDWMLEKCVKDCDESSDASCGGLANRWDELHSSSSACCDRLWYIERDECTV